MVKLHLDWIRLLEISFAKPDVCAHLRFFLGFYQTISSTPCPHSDTDLTWIYTEKILSQQALKCCPSVFGFGQKMVLLLVVSVSQ